MNICMTGFAGDKGARELADKNIEKLKTLFPASFLRRIFDKKNVSVAASSPETIDSELIIPIEKGLYQSLWELGEMLGCGMEITHADIPIKQESIEVCEALDISPYEIPSSGYLFVMPEGEAPADRIMEGRVIGHTTNKNDRVVYFGSITRYLNKPR